MLGLFIKILLKVARPYNW